MEDSPDLEDNLELVDIPKEVDIPEEEACLDHILAGPWVDILLVELPLEVASLVAEVGIHLEAVDFHTDQPSEAVLDILEAVIAAFI